MDIDTCIQDEDGVSALMYASKNPSLLFVVEYLVKDGKCLNLLDKDGNNALIYALNNINALNILLKTDIDINNKNSNNESIILYCCKYDIYEPIPILTDRKDINVNVMDNEERTPAMYLGEKARKDEFLWLNKRDCNYNFKNKNNESALSHIINSMYLSENYSKSGTFIQCIKMIISLVHFGCDFNYPIDEA